MGITDKLSQVAGQVQGGVKTTSLSLFAMTLKIVTAVVFSLTLSMIIQELMGSGTLVFVFTLVLGIGLLMKVMAKWGAGAVLLFDLFCILTALLLRLYLQVAP
jgi:hypothetical protein